MRHNIATALNSFTDGESYIIGFIKFTNVDGTNHHHLSKAIEMMKDAGRGTWCWSRHIISTLNMTDYVTNIHHNRDI